MAGDFNGYVHHRDGNRFYVVHADTLEVLNGDDLGAAFLDVLFYHSTNELRNRHHNINAPKSWPCDIWVKQDMTTLVCKWMFGSTSVRSLQGRIDWLVNVGMVETKQADRSSPKEYRLNVERLNKMIREEKSVVSYKDFCRSANLPDEEGSANLPDPFGNSADPIADPSFIYKSSSIHILKSENSEALSEDLPSEEKTKPSEPQEERSITITREDLSPEDPIEVFVKNNLSRHCRVNPKLNTRAGLQMVGRLCEAQDRWGIQEFRAAFLVWCQSTDDYLKKNKYPLNHFLKHVSDYLDAPVTDARAEAPAAAGSIPGRQPMVTDPAPPSPRLTGLFLADTWNGIVTTKPHWDDSRMLKIPAAEGFDRELFVKVCEEAKRLLDADPVKFSYVALPWALKQGESGYNWRRLLNREFDCMIAPDSKNRGSGVGDRVVEKYRKLAEEARKKKEEDDEDAV